MRYSSMCTPMKGRIKFFKTKWNKINVTSYLDDKLILTTKHNYLPNVLDD